MGRLTQLDQEGQTGGNSVSAKRVDFGYNAIGQFTEIERFADLAGTLDVATSTYTYDDASRLTDLDHSHGSTSLADYSWTWDVGGRLTSVTSVDGTDDYTYDDTSQLTDVDSDYQTDESYTYDGTGNRTNTGYTTGSNNQLTSDGTYNYEYDDEGNRTKKTTISSGAYVEYDWDHRNRLTTVTFCTSTGTKTKEVSYVYDAFDRRIAKDVDANGNGTVDSGERYVYDASEFQAGIGGALVDPTRAFGWVDDIVLVFDESGTLVERLLHGPQVDQVLASEDASGNVQWFLGDHLGTIRDVVEYDSGTDSTTVVNHLQYSSFGQITSQTSSANEPRYAFTGREWDADADLYYYRARWYDPNAGRFISEDPIGFAAGDVNVSRYVGNAAAFGADPSGLAEPSIAIMNIYVDVHSHFPGGQNPLLVIWQRRLIEKRMREAMVLNSLAHIHINVIDLPSPLELGHLKPPKTMDQYLQEGEIPTTNLLEIPLASGDGHYTRYEWLVQFKPDLRETIGGTTTIAQVPAADKHIVEIDPNAVWTYLQKPTVQNGGSNDTRATMFANILLHEVFTFGPLGEITDANAATELTDRTAEANHLIQFTAAEREAVIEFFEGN